MRLQEPLLLIKIQRLLRARVPAIAMAEWKAGALDTAEVGVGVLQPSVGTVTASSSLPMGGGFRQGLQRAQSPAIVLAE